MLRSDRRGDPVVFDSTAFLMLCMALLVLLSGCPAIQTWEDMTPKAKALWMMSVYDREFEDYMAQAAHPEQLSEAQKAVLRVKKVALRKAWPLIKFYVAMVDKGAASVEAERAALEAVRELVVATAEEVSNG